MLPYLLRVDKRQKGRETENPIFHTNMFGESAQELTEELRFSADLNDRVERTYVQYKVSFPPGEDPDLVTKVGIVEALLAARGHGRNCQFLAVEHFEKVEKHDVHHFHVLASTVRLDGRWVDDSYERVRLKGVERAIEQEFGLLDCTPRPRGERVRASIREGKLRESGTVLGKDVLRGVLEELLGVCPTLPLLMVQVKARGFGMRFHEFEDGKGVSFGVGERYFQGRQLGDKFTFGGLQEFAGVEYLPERDDPLLRRLNGISMQECRELLGQGLEVKRLNQTSESAVGLERESISPVSEQGTEIREPECQDDQWQMARLILEFSQQRLKETKRKHWQSQDERYACTIDPEGNIAVVDQGNGKSIAVGRYTEEGWQVRHAQVQESDAEHFRRYQQEQAARQNTRKGMFKTKAYEPDELEL